MFSSSGNDADRSEPAAIGSGEAEEAADMVREHNDAAMAANNEENENDTLAVKTMHNHLSAQLALPGPSAPASAKQSQNDAFEKQGLQRETSSHIYNEFCHDPEEVEQLKTPKGTVSPEKQERHAKQTVHRSPIISQPAGRPAAFGTQVTTQLSIPPPEQPRLEGFERNTQIATWIEGQNAQITSSMLAELQQPNTTPEYISRVNEELDAEFDPQDDPRNTAAREASLQEAIDHELFEREDEYYNDIIIAKSTAWDEELFYEEVEKPLLDEIDEEFPDDDARAHHQRLEEKAKIAALEKRYLQPHYDEHLPNIPITPNGQNPRMKKRVSQRITDVLKMC